jgi:lipid II:glycine glycyltransferase (peptidoglycan interpeptide bridge formation enzyme)
MYVPYTKERYAEQAMVETEEEFSNQVADGSLQLFFVIHEGRRLAGGALSVRGETPRFRYLGILDADPKLRKLGVLPALYVYVLDWAKRHGHERVNLGGCRPFLKDGVLQFKKKFNMSLSNGGYRKILYINPLSMEKAVTACLASNPFIRLDGEHLVVTVFESAGHESTTPDALWQISGELLAGLDRVERLELV